MGKLGKIDKNKQSGKQNQKSIKHVHFHTTKSVKTKNQETQITKYGLNSRHNFSQTISSDFKIPENTTDDFDFASKLQQFNLQAFNYEQMKQDVAKQFYDVLTKPVDASLCKSIQRRLGCYNIRYAEKFLEIKSSIFSSCLNKFREIYPNYKVDTSFLLKKIFN